MSTNKKLFVALCCFLVLAGVSFHLITNSSKYKTQEQQRNNATVKHDVNTRLPHTYLNNVIAQSGAGTSVYYKSLVSSDLFYNYSGKMQAEGMIRPFIMAKAMSEVEKGNLKLDQKIRLIESNITEGSPALLEEQPGAEIALGLLLEKMITVNDNTAANMLIDLLGMDAINEYAQSQGYPDTELAVKMGDKAKVQAEQKLSTDKKIEVINYTSVNDLVTFFTRLYEGKCVSPTADKQMLAILEKSRDNKKLGALLPKGVVMAHQVGETAGTINDAGIVYGKEPYILAIMTDNSVDSSRTLKTVNQISSIIYNAVTDKEVFKK